MNNDVLTVKQFAKIAGVSAQAVYKRINHKESTIQPYVVNRVNPQGKTQTYLDISILDNPKLNPKHQPVNPVNSQPINQEPDNPSTVDDQPINPVDQPVEESETASGSVLIESLTARISDKDEEIKRLVAQLETKDKQIERLTDSLQFEQKKNEELATKLHLLQAPAEDQPDPPAQPEQPQKGFRAWWNSFWNISTPQK